MALRLDGRAWLRIEPELLAELRICDGDDVDEVRVTTIEETLARTRARLFVVRSLAARAQSVAEIERKLATREIPEHIAREAIESASEHGYLADVELAGQLARGMRSRRYGRRRAEATLRRRGIGDADAEAALAAAYGGEDEVGLARAALRGRALADDDAGRRQAAEYLLRRGFSSTAAWHAVRAELGARRP